MTHKYIFKKEDGIWYRRPTRGGRWGKVPGFNQKNIERMKNERKMMVENDEAHFHNQATARIYGRMG